MSGNQYTTPRSNPQARANSNHVSSTSREDRYANIVLDVVESEILSALSARQGQVLTILAGMARTDSRSSRYRTAYLRQGWLAGKMGLSRQAVNVPLRFLERHDIIANMGKGWPNGKRTGSQPVTFYQVAGIEDLISISMRLERDKSKRKMTAKDVERVRYKSVQGVKCVGHLEGEKVSSARDTLLSSARDTYPPKVSSARDTKRDVDLKRDVEKGLGSPAGENGDNSNGNSIGEVKEEQFEGFDPADSFEQRGPVKSPEDWLDILNRAGGMDRPAIIRRAVADQGGHINGETVPLLREESMAFLVDRFTQLDVMRHNAPSP